MSALIRLATPTPSSTAASARIAYAVGRSLTAADFSRYDRYIAQRLLGIVPGSVGVITGLGVSPARFDSRDNVSGLTQLTVGTGYGVGGDGRLIRVSAPITIAWANLLRVVRGTGKLADGAYLLLVQTAEFAGLAGPPPDPCQRGSADPLLDERRDSFVEVNLSQPVGALPSAMDSGTVALAINTLVGRLTSETLRSACGNGIPLALVFVANEEAILLSEAAGRLPADPDGPRAMLLAQMREAFAMALSETGANPTLEPWQVATSARFRYLPAAGELPLSLLLSPTQVNASCPFFTPSGTTVYLRAIRASQSSQMIRRAVSRAPLDLTGGVARGVILSLAVPDASWKPDLLDIPRADPVLAADVHLAYARARAAQVSLREAWIALYGGITQSVSQTIAMAIGFLLTPDTAAAQLPVGNPAAMRDAADKAGSPADLAAWIASPQSTITGVTAPSDLVGQLAQQGYQVLDAEPALADPAAATHAPVASDQVLHPLFQLQSFPAGSTFSDWSRAITAEAPDPQLLQPLIDAGLFDANADPTTRSQAIATLLALPPSNAPPNDDTQPGALLSLTILQLFYAAFSRAVRAQELRLTAHNRLIAVQRLHLDVMSTSVSALAGGVPTDGSGLKFARIIPFFKLQPAPPPTTTAPAAMAPITPIAPAASGVSPAAMRLSTLSNVGSTVLGTVGVGTRGAGTIATGFSGAGGLGVGSVGVSTSGSGTLSRDISVANLSNVVARAPAFTQTVLNPGSSGIGSLIGGTDIAATVAAEIGTVSQAPPFTYQPVQYGSAAHITPGSTLKQTSDTGLSALRQLMTDPAIGLTVPPLPTPPPTSGAQGDEAAAYSGILDNTRGLLSDIGLVERNAILIETNYLTYRDLMQSLEARITTFTQNVATTRDNLRAAQGAAAKAAGDYAAAQRLVQEEVARVNAAQTSRNAAIAAAAGLFYVRQLQTNIARPLAPALELIADTPADIVPGCAADHAGPPAAVQPFLDLLLEVPLANWYWLRDSWTDLPDIAGIQRLGMMRTARVSGWTFSSNFGTGAAAADLATIASVTRGVFDPLFQSTVSISASLAQTQQAALNVFSFHDIVTLRTSGLWSAAAALRRRLESAAGCLSEILTALPPSARFAWAADARNGTLPPLTFSQWKLPPGLGDAGTAAVRRLAAIVNWIAGQLHDRSTAEAQTALSNLVRASVIAAAYGDPDDAVTGAVTTGVALLPGLPIRVILNRLTPIGTVLHVFDANQAVVGTVRVTDHDTYGTSATVVTSYSTAAAASNWTVGVLGARAPRLLS